jgi:hypothetical protein
VPPAATTGRLFFIKDTVSSKKLLVDTGSAFSLFPHRSKQHPCRPRLSAANRQLIRCWGSDRRSLQLAEQQYTWNFLQAAVSFPILGIDFLKHFELLIDVVSEKLIPRSSVLGGSSGTKFLQSSGTRLTRPRHMPRWPAAQSAAVRQRGLLRPPSTPPPPIGGSS